MGKWFEPCAFPLQPFESSRTTSVKSVERKNRQRCQTSKCTFVATAAQSAVDWRKQEATSCVAREQSARNVALPGKKTWQRRPWAEQGGGVEPTPTSNVWTGGADSHAHAMHHFGRGKQQERIIWTFTFSHEPEKNCCRYRKVTQRALSVWILTSATNFSQNYVK